MLTAKRRRFVAEYLIDLNATQAAIRAGYNKKTAYSQGQRLLKNVEVLETLAASQARHLEQAELKAARVLEELRRIAFFDIRCLFDGHGKLRQLDELAPEQAAAIASHQSVKKTLNSGAGKVDEVVKVRMHDKLKALELLAKHFALLTEPVQHVGAVQFSWKESEA